MRAPPVRIVSVIARSGLEDSRLVIVRCSVTLGARTSGPTAGTRASFTRRDDRAGAPARRGLAVHASEVFDCGEPDDVREA